MPLNPLIDNISDYTPNNATPVNSSGPTNNVKSCSTTEFASDILRVHDDEEASELVFNRPNIHLSDRTTVLKNKLHAVIAKLNTALQPSEVVVAVAGDTTPVTEKVYVVTGSGTFNFMLPALPAVGADRLIITVKDMTGNVGSNTITLKRNTTADTIDGKTEDYALRTNYETVILVGHNTGWFMIKSGGSGTGGATPVTFIDPLSTVLPSGTYNTGTPLKVDNVQVSENDTILFTNLTTGGNKVYKITGVTNNGDTITTQVEYLFNGETPENGAAVRVLKGDGFKNQLAIFDGTDWKVNDTIRMFNGADYWESTSLRTVNIANNTTADIFDVTAASSENMVIHYAIKRGSTKEVGTLLLTHNGTIAELARTATNNVDVGVKLDVALVAGTPQKIKLSYTSTNAGVGGGMKYFISRWSDAAGGPAGVPNYSNAVVPSGVAAAAGADKNIQFNDGGSALGADTKFNWDKNKKELELNGLRISALSAEATLADNTTVATNIASFPIIESVHFVVEYSVVRGSNTRAGRMLMTSNGTLVGFEDSHVETTPSGTGVVFTAVVDGSNIVIKYTLTSAGNTAAFKYSVRRWI